jgi:hypothetical protein
MRQRFLVKPAKRRYVRDPLQNTRLNVQTFVFRLPGNELFSTRDVLHCGPRHKVDQTLYLMVKEEAIFRQIDGVFSKNPFKEFSTIEIARKKVESFGREILEEPVVDEFGNITFYVNGCSSSFKVRDKTVTVKGLGMRKFKLGATKAGAIARAIWQDGRVQFTINGMRRKMQDLRHGEVKDLIRFAPYLPAWLNDFANNLKVPRDEDWGD